MSKQICFASLVTIIQLLALITAGSAAASSVTASPTSMNFGSVNVGSSAQQQVRITNSMPFGVIITSVTVSGNYFGLSGVTAPLGVAAGASATLTVSFAPKAAGTQTGKIVVLGRGFSTALDITLSADGVSSGGSTSISVVPTSAIFGSVPVGSSNSQTFTVTNRGSSTISVSSESISGTGFSMSGLGDGAQIGAGRSATFNVTFKPANTGASAGSASINFSASGKSVPLTVSLSGSGVTATGALQVSPSAINFGDVLVGHSGSLSLKLTNTGNSALTTSRGTITGSGFSMIGGLSGLTLQPGQSDSVVVVFEPAVTGSASGTISVVAGLTTAWIALSGYGFSVTAPPPAQSLLSGCTVSASNQPNCSIPSGWMLVKAEGFDSGNLAPNETIDQNASITTNNAHTGSHSMQGHYGSDGDRVSWFLNQGTIGNLSELYISYWDYADPNAQYGNSDYFLVDIVNHDACGGQGQDFGYDAQDFTGSLAPVSTSTMIGVSQGPVNTAGCQGLYQYQTGAKVPMNAGVWRQVEIHYKPSTSGSLPASGNVPNCNNLSPTANGCGDGEAELYINGQLKSQQLNANLNGTQSMSGKSIEIGGTITDFCDQNGTRAVPFSKCPANAPTPFNRYIDDIIVLKK
jgi:hypothetical protein